MKNKLLLLFVLIATCGYAQNVSIPDANFKTYLVGNSSININGDSEIQVSEATAFTGEIDIYNLGITDLTGVEAFTALTELQCSSNQLTSLDLSANTALTELHCNNNQLTTLDVSGNTALTNLRCQNNQLTSLNLPATTNALTDLRISYNQLTSLDVSANTALTLLACNFNQLTSLNVSANTALENLYFYDNPITSIDVSANTALIELDLGFNPITSIDVSANTALQGLYFTDTQITSIDVSNNTALKWVYCENSQLTSLDLSTHPNLEEITCSNTQLTSLNIASGNNGTLDYFDATNNTALTCIEVDAAIVGTTPTGWSKDAGATYSANCTACNVNIPDANFKAYLVGNTTINTNGDTEIQCSEASAFTGSISCANLSISDLTGIEAFTALTQLKCNNNQLTSLDLSANIALTSLECYDNNIVGLDLSTNIALTSITSYRNNLTSLNIANGFNTNITFLTIGNNLSLTCIQVDANIVGTSPNNWFKDVGATYSASCATAGSVTYVNLSAAGNNDGTSWADAYTSLQDALINAPASNNIWVAKGTYKPHASDVDVSFIANNTIYGGFAGTETDVSDRDLSLIHTTNETILSGDLNNDDATTIGFNDTTRDDNSKHVLEIAITNLEVNGFTIKDGNANGTGDDRFGAGIYKEKIAANTTIKNCVIKNNVSSNAGAGLAITSLDDSIIIVDACVIENNLSPAGSGIDYHMSTPGKTMNITVTNSLFNANKTDDNGGIKGTGASAARFRAYYSGVTLTTTLVNNTFVNNSSKGDSGNNPAGNFPVVGLSKNSGDFGTLIIANNIFWDNVTNGNTTALATGKTAAISGVPVSYDFLGNNTDESNYLSSNNTNPNLDANFKLTAASTTEIDGGVNNQIPTGITTDLAGNQRVFNTTVDRGVYEFGSAPLSVDNFFIEDEISIYPNPTATFLKIKMDSNLKRATIYSVLGAKVLETTSKNITTSNLKRGLYLIKIEDEDGSISTKRFLKK